MQNIRCTPGSEAHVEPHTIFFIVSGDTDLLAIHFDEESHEEASEGVPSIPGRDKAGSLQEISTHPP